MIDLDQAAGEITYEFNGERSASELFADLAATLHTLGYTARSVIADGAAIYWAPGKPYGIGVVVSTVTARSACWVVQADGGARVGVDRPATYDGVLAAAGEADALNGGGA